MERNAQAEADELAELLDAEETVASHNVGEFPKSVDVQFVEGQLAHSEVLNMVQGRGYNLQYVNFEERSVCFIKSVEADQ